VNRHPNIAFFGGTVIIAIMVMAELTAAKRKNSAE